MAIISKPVVPLSWVLDPAQLPMIIAAASIALLVSSVSLVLYNWLLHPLRDFKGPLLARITPIWLVRSVSRGHVNLDMSELHRIYGPVVRVSPNELSFSSEQALKDIHMTKAADFTKKGTSEELIFKLIFAAPNLLTTHDPVEHKALRDALQPAFTTKALLEQEEITQHHVGEMIEKLKRAAQNPSQPISLTRVLDEMIWGTVGNLAFGEPTDVKHLDHHNIMKQRHIQVAAILETFQYLTTLPIAGDLSKLTLTLARMIVKPTKNILGMSKLKEHIVRQEGKKDFLTAIMGAKEAAQLGPDELLSNMTLLLIGGFDSTAMTSSAIFHYFLQNPDKYATLRSEIRGSYASPDDIDCNSLLRQPFLNACVNEVLRLIPAFNGHATHRMTCRNTTVDGTYVPAGTLVSADIYTLQRDPEHWAFPNQFCPERWLSECNGPGTPFEKDNRNAWRPFLVGHRVCIGREMALQTLRLAVAKIVYMFDLTLVNRDFIWDRDTGNHFLWHNFSVIVKVAHAGC